MRVSTSLLSAAAFVPLAYGQLNKLAVAKDLKYFGSATDNGELSDTAYVAILSDKANFGQITPGNTQKWMYVEPEQGTFDFTQGDVITNFAETNGQLLRCHNLVWYNELPSWGKLHSISVIVTRANKPNSHFRHLDKCNSNCCTSDPYPGRSYPLQRPVLLLGCCKRSSER
jgi:GH35 family endo-1,4-beta-xylanase